MNARRIAEVFRSMEYGPAPESPEPAFRWLDGHGRTFGHQIAGAWTPFREGDVLQVIAPGSGDLLARVTIGSESDVTDAVAAARAALPGWSARSGTQRAKVMYALARGIQKHARTFAVLESLDNGKPFRESRDLDVPLAIRHLYHHAGWARLAEREFPGHGPIGVCAQIVPWNFPLLMAAWKIAPALAAGNTVVLKPAEDTPLTALLLADVAREAGVPPGVLNVVTGDGTTGAALVRAEVDKVAFTGSTEVGRAIRVATAGTGTRLSLELGGKSPFIVFDDADLDAAIEGLVDAIWFNQGQVCCAGSRLLVHEGIADAFHDRLKRRMATLRIGDPLDKAIDMGAIVSDVQKRRIEAWVQTGIDEGATCWTPPVTLPDDGFYLPPTLLTNVHAASTVAREEIFGPVLVSMTFRTPDEAIDLANDTRYGLAASVWSENVNLALHVAPRLAAGVVWINGTNQFDAAAGFGGYRESGFGREGGREGMFEYLAPRAATQSTAAPTPPIAARPAIVVEGPAGPGATVALHASVDVTAKLYVGGRQTRPDGGRSFPAIGRGGRIVGQASLANRKDVRDAVEAARKATGWSKTKGHARAQILYYLAENLDADRASWHAALAAWSDRDDEACAREVDAAIDRLFAYAAWADKFDGRVHDVPSRTVVLAMHEPWGVTACVAPDEPPLLGLVSMVAPLIAMGNRVVAVASQTQPLIVRQTYAWLDASDVPAGVVNLLSGAADELAADLADHDEVACIWYAGSAAGSAEVERRSAGNLKACWVDHGVPRDWFDDGTEGDAFLRHAVQVKNVWIPYGE